MINTQAASNEKAQSIFKLNPNGTDEHKEIKDGPISVQISYNKVEEKLELVHMYLNDEALYFLNQQANGYRGVMGSIMLNTIYDPEVDEVKMG